MKGSPPTLVCGDSLPSTDTQKNTAAAIFNSNTTIQPVRLLVSARGYQSANSVFLSQQTSTSQPKINQRIGQLSA